MGQERGKHDKLEVTIRHRKNSSLAQILKRQCKLGGTEHLRLLI